MGKIVRYRRFRPKRFRGFRHLGPVPLLVLIALLLALDPKAPRNPVFATPLSSSDGTDLIICSHPYVLDGDTIDCNGRRVRLSGIDAPEMPDHCRPGRQCTPGDPFASKAALHALTRTTVTCRQTDTDVYGRAVARCEANGQDLSCAMLKAKQAVRRYDSITCN